MAARRGPADIGTELDETLLRARRYLRTDVVSADMRTLQKSGGREAGSFYGDRCSYDKVVRSTHGMNCTGSCSRKVYVKDGIITWEAQQTDYPSSGRTGPTTSRAAARAARCSPGTPTRRLGSAIPMCAACCWSCSGRPGPAAAATRSMHGPRSPAIPTSCVATSQPAARATSSGRAGMRRWSSRRSRTCTRSVPGSGPDRRAQPDPGDEHGQPCRGRPRSTRGSARRCCRSTTGTRTCGSPPHRSSVTRPTCPSPVTGGALPTWCCAAPTRQDAAGG